MSVDTGERITPKAFMNHMLSPYGVTADGVGVGKTVVGAWSRTFIEQLAQLTGAVRLERWPHETAYSWDSDAGRVTLIPFPVGAPAAVSTVESLIACGAERIVGIGFTGSLQPSVRVGEIVLPVTCLREEGTSGHYMAGGEDAAADPGLLKKLETILQKENIGYHKGRIWTTDAIFRELRTKIADYARRGILGVEMETSALYAAGAFRGVEVCNLLVVSDEIWGEWNPHLVGSRRVENAVSSVGRALARHIGVLGA